MHRSVYVFIAVFIIIGGASAAIPVKIGFAASIEATRQAQAEVLRVRWNNLTTVQKTEVETKRKNNASLLQGALPVTPPSAPAGDTTAPVISSVVYSDVTQTSATITWATNEPSDSQIEYGLTTAYGSQTTSDTSSVTSHSVNLTGLTAGATYYYRVKSKDAAGNLATSASGSFVTNAATAIFPTGCVPLLVNGDQQNKVDVLFEGDGFLTDSEMDQFVATAQEYMGLTGTNGLFNIEPFKLYKDRFNVFYVNEKTTLGGCFMGGTTPCDSTKINALKAQCLADEVILIWNENYYHKIGENHAAFAATGNHFASALGPNSVSFQGVSFRPNQAAHEFGHAFGGLKDLYFTERYNFLNVAQMPNIDSFGCQKWCSGMPSIPQPTNSTCPTFTNQTDCASANVFPKCAWQALSGTCQILGIDYACNAYGQSFGGDAASCAAAYSGVPEIQCEMNPRGDCLFKGDSFYQEHFVNVGQQCQAGYGCYQGAEGLNGYSAEPSRNTIMGYMTELRFDIASYEHLVNLLSQYTAGTVSSLNQRNADFLTANIIAFADMVKGAFRLVSFPRLSVAK